MSHSLEPGKSSEEKPMTEAETLNLKSIWRARQLTDDEQQKRTKQKSAVHAAFINVDRRITPQLAGNYYF
jgi:hypothetical protein